MENVIILGSGCAGWPAAIYAARANLEPLVIGGNEEGGQLALTTDVENYPGFPDGIQGPKLIEEMKKQALKFGARHKTGAATSFAIQKDHFELVVGKETLQARMLIIGTGASARMLGLPAEKEFMGKGIHTCATCDGFFYKGKELIVVGGGDSMAEEANFLTKFAKKVTVVHRRDAFRASKIMQKRVLDNPKIEVLWDTTIDDIQGDDKGVNKVVLKNVKSGETKEASVDGVFYAIGHVPNTKIFKENINMDEHGFIITNEDMQTNIPGVFACGDVQDPVWKQAITAAGTGAAAAIAADKYFEEWKEKNKEK
jgi:thioredoxin reductase (NADPH)